MIKPIIVAIFILGGMAARIQKRTDLNRLQLHENVEQLLKGVPDVIKGEMFPGAGMFSYGLNNNKKFSYSNYLPEHIEMLSYKGELAGFAFKIFAINDQQKLISFLKQKYKGLSGTKYKDDTYYSYKDHHVFIEFQTFSKEKFDKGMNAYLSVKRLDFYEAFEKLAEH